MDPNKIELKSINKLFEYEKHSRLIDEMDKEIDLIDIINCIDKITPDIKLTPLEILQYVMITIQKKFNIEFKIITKKPK